MGPTTGPRGGTSRGLETMGAVQPHDLYGLPLERFTPERNALAKQLRAERRRDEAAEVAALRKPTVEAWAVNQLVRTQRRELDALFEAGERLAQAQADLLAGQGDSRALRESLDAERTAVARLTERARGLLSQQGRELTPAVLQRVSDTLHAAALHEDARAQVRDGCLNVGLRHIGLGTVAATSTSRLGAEPRATPRAPSPSPSASEQEAAEREAARVAAERVAALKIARQREADARRQMERTVAEVETAAQCRDRAAAALGDAETVLAKAREQAQRAAEDHRRAQAALDQL